MSKILTISIAAFNVEKYIKTALDSLIVPEIIDKLEVFIIDDGGTDNTLAIAQEYADKFPKTFFPVHKKNEGYGSTVEYSVNHATGKYFKLLDGDDWLSQKNLSNFIERLESSDADAFVSNATKVIENKSANKMYSFIENIDGKVLNTSKAVDLPIVAMWAYTFKTSIVKKCFKKLPYHTLYTDQIFVIYSLTDVKNIEYYGKNIYNWRIGRNEQSNSLNSICKHYKDIITVMNIINSYCHNLENKSMYLLKRAGAYYSTSLYMLLKLKKSRKNKKLIEEWEKEVKCGYPEIYKASEGISGKIYLLRNSNYILYWILK